MIDPDGSSLTENFTGGWAACNQCADLVRTGQRRTLLARALASVPFTSASEHAAYRARARRFTPRSSHPARTRRGPRVKAHNEQ